MRDTKLIVDTISELQEENEKLKNKLEKLEKIKEIVAKYDRTIPSMMCRFYDIQKVLEQE